MKRKLIQLFIYYLYKKKLFSHKDIRKIKYGIEVIVNEVIKLTILTIIFTVLKGLTYFGFSLCILLSVRTFSGGMHFDTNLKCLLFSILFFMIACNFSTYIPILPSSVNYMIAILCMLVIALLSPCPSINRPIINKKKQQTCKLFAVLITLIWFSYLFYKINNSILFKCGITTISILSIQLIFGYYINRVNQISRRIQNEITY